jgi:hypothetical protein
MAVKVVNYGTLMQKVASGDVFVEGLHEGDGTTGRVRYDELRIRCGKLDEFLPLVAECCLCGEVLVVIEIERDRGFAWASIKHPGMLQFKLTGPGIEEVRHV